MKYNDYPEKKQAYIGAKLCIKQSNINIYYISNEFLLYVIDRIKSFNQEILTGLDTILSYQNK